MRDDEASTAIELPVTLPALPYYLCSPSGDRRARLMKLKQFPDASQLCQ